MDPGLPQTPLPLPLATLPLLPGMLSRPHRRGGNGGGGRRGGQTGPAGWRGRRGQGRGFERSGWRWEGMALTPVGLLAACGGSEGSCPPGEREGARVVHGCDPRAVRGRVP